MTARRDPDHLIKAFLEDGLTELPDRTYDAVRSQIDHTRQRVVIGPWRFPAMNNYVRYGLAAAAVVLVALIGFNLLPKSGGVGTSPSSPPASASPTERPSPTPPPSGSPAVTPTAVRLPPDGALAPGSYFIDRSHVLLPADRVTFALPAGWTTTEATEIAKHRDEPGEVLLSPWVLTHVFSNACQWDEDQVVQVQTVDEIVAALTDQAGREASTPVDVTIGGYAAKQIQLAVAPDLDVATCTNGNQRYWPGAGVSVPNFGSGLCCNPPGNTDVVYVVDLPTPLVIVARYYPESSEADRAELQSIVESMRFEL